jgi:hypothetical protein
MRTISLKTNKEPSKDGNRCTVCLHTCDCPAVKQFGLNFMNRLHEIFPDSEGGALLCNESAYCSYCRKYYIAGRRHSCKVHSQPPLPPEVKSD